jgi:hypothetical protein
MPVWIVLAVLATVVVTAGLTLILARLNQPQEQNRRARGGDATIGYGADGGGSGKAKPDHGDGGGDAGGDGGGGE